MDLKNLFKEEDLHNLDLVSLVEFVTHVEDISVDEIFENVKEYINIENYVEFQKYRGVPQYISEFTYKTTGPVSFIPETPSLILSSIKV